MVDRQFLKESFCNRVDKINYPIAEIIATSVDTSFHLHLSVLVNCPWTENIIWICFRIFNHYMETGMLSHLDLMNNLGSAMLLSDKLTFLGKLLILILWY